MATKTVAVQTTFSNGSIVKIEGLECLQSKLAQYNLQLTPQEIVSHIEKQVQGATSGRSVVVGFNWNEKLEDYAAHLDIFYVGKTKESVEINPEFNKYSIATKPQAVKFRKVSVYNFAY